MASSLKVLDRIPLFRLMNDRDRREIAAEAVEVRYAKGQHIFSEGDPAQFFHILKDGAVKCMKSSCTGRACTLKVLMPGELFCCDAAVFDGGTHPGTAEALGDVTILRLSKAAYLDILRRNPDAALDVIRYLGQRLKEAQEHAKVLALDRAEQRLASLLVELGTRAGVPEAHGLRLSVHLTRQDLADMTGTTVETTIRIMSRFKREKLVSGTARHLTIRNLNGLRELASLPVPASA
jgi:CRP/FNR family transcriptional regulator